MIDLAQFRLIVAELRAAGFADADIEWSENVKPPASAEEFAQEAIFVICNSGMKNTVARRIYDRVMDALEQGLSAGQVFGHKGKSRAIDRIWRDRLDLYLDYLMRQTDEERLAFIVGLPWIGNITKFHLAKNFGANLAKPDVHLQRLAEISDETVQGLCDRLATASGYRAATVDLILWRACAEGIVQSRTGEFRPREAA